MPSASDQGPEEGASLDGAPPWVGSPDGSELASGPAVDVGSAVGSGVVSGVAGSGVGSGVAVGLGVGSGVGFGFGLGLAAAQQAGAALNRPASPPPAAGPPPLPVKQWYIGVNGQQQGPFDQAGLAGQARSGALTRETLVWSEGMAGWTAAGQVPELSPVFGAVPPPLPPQA
jgi:hypothetical protein